jgi:hypothetical protein
VSGAGSLTSTELTLAERLSESGFGHAEATLAVAIFTRDHYRTQEELIDQIKIYPGLSERAEALSAISSLTARKWILKEERAPGIAIFRANPAIPEMYLEEVEDPKLVQLLNRERLNQSVIVTILGHMRDPIVYESFGSKIRNTQNDLMLPMIHTSPNLRQVQEITEIAKSGARVRVLLATPTLTFKLRGNSARSASRTAIKGWLKNSEGIRSFQVRVTNIQSDLLLASSVSFDDRLVRINFFDPVRQRTTQGTMVEIQADTPSNISMLFADHFNTAWSRAREPTFRGTVAWCIRRYWLLLTAAVLGAITATTINNSTTFAFLSGILTGIVTNFLPRVPDWTQQVISRLRGHP